MTSKNPPSTPSMAPLGSGAWLDWRRAVVHPAERWLAIADLHYGYEIVQRTHGALYPAWGTETIDSRIHALLDHHRPECLLLLGDIIHAPAAIEPLLAAVQRWQKAVPQLILIAGNHDRRLHRHLPLLPIFQIGRWLFHHGHQPAPTTTAHFLLQGHLHPLWMWNDHRGTRLRIPALVQRTNHWILPAFSPWAAGTRWSSAPGDLLHLCHPQGVHSLPPSPHPTPQRSGNRHSPQTDTR